MIQISDGEFLELLRHEAMDVPLFHEVLPALTCLPFLLPLLWGADPCSDMGPAILPAASHAVAVQPSEAALNQRCGSHCPGAPTGDVLEGWTDLWGLATRPCDKRQSSSAADTHPAYFPWGEDPEYKQCFWKKSFLSWLHRGPHSQLKPSPRWAMQKADKEAENRSWFPALSRQRLCLPLPLLLCSLEVL